MAARDDFPWLAKLETVFGDMLPEASAALDQIDRLRHQIQHPNRNQQWQAAMALFRPADVKDSSSSSPPSAVTE